MIRTLSEALTLKVFTEAETPFVSLNPSTKFGFVADAEGQPVRVVGPRVYVPMTDWRKDGIDESSIIGRVMVEMGAANPLNVPSPEAMRPQTGFWQKIPNPRAILINPKSQGKFFQPGIQTFALDVVPEGQLLLLRPAHMVGYWVIQGSKRGIVAHCKEGVMTIRFGR